MKKEKGSKLYGKVGLGTSFGVMVEGRLALCFKTDAGASEFCIRHNGDGSTELVRGVFIHKLMENTMVFPLVDHPRSFQGSNQPW